jgi:hypothetical protein
MVLSSQLVPGRIYSFDYMSTVDMVKTREFNGLKEVNPLYSEDITVRRLVTCQAAGKLTYENMMRKLNGEDWQKSDRKDWASVDPTNDCILVHDKSQERYLRAIPRGIVREEYYVGSKAATDADVALIRKFKKNQSDTPPVYVRFKLDNIVNLQDDGDEDERPA